MELEIETCFECASVVRGGIQKFEEKKNNLIDIKISEKCSKCGKDIRVRGMKIEFEKKFWGGMNFLLTRY